MGNEQNKECKNLEQLRKEKETRMSDRFEIVQKECYNYGFKTWTENNRIYIETPNGKWYFNGKEEQVHLMHKNYRFRQSTMGNYHRQFIKDIDMHALLNFISRHDKESYDSRKK